MNDYLPISKKDMRKRGWDEVDFVYVCGDAYVDHPSFGMAIITRLRHMVIRFVSFLSQTGKMLRSLDVLESLV